mmetsp:Transcript_64999/g.141688  ORF Transcript_64999/g.141688 Transcript_64999/m.141688 type:complete len:238 (+) Transcript_64999:258-971(+)
MSFMLHLRGPCFRTGTLRTEACASTSIQHPALQATAALPSESTATMVVGTQVPKLELKYSTALPTLHLCSNLAIRALCSSTLSQQPGFTSKIKAPVSGCSCWTVQSTHFFCVLLQNRARSPTFHEVRGPHSPSMARRNSAKLTTPSPSMSISAMRSWLLRPSRSRATAGLERACCISETSNVPEPSLSKDRKMSESSESRMARCPSSSLAMNSEYWMNPSSPTSAETRRSTRSSCKP